MMQIKSFEELAIVEATPEQGIAILNIHFGQFLLYDGSATKYGL
jgi:hypothetical protein